MTPFDAKVAGTFAEKPKFEKAEPRALTGAEVHANNTAMVELGRIIGDFMCYAPMIKQDLDDMNRGKRGHPFEYSDLLILWLMSVQTMFDSTFRLTVGHYGGLLAPFGIDVPSPSRYNERANELAERYRNHTGEDGILAVYVSTNVLERERELCLDSSGVNLSAVTCWRKKKWRTEVKDRGWLKIHVLSDVDTGEMVVAYLTWESVGDAPLLKPIVKTAMEDGHRFKILYADGAYSSNENWIFLCRDNSIRFVTSFKVNTTPTSNGCFARGEAAELWCSLPYDEWVKATGYGRRWKGECTFSDFKRIFPETVTARTELGMVREIMCRMDLFNLYKEIRAKIMKVTGNGVVVG